MVLNQRFGGREIAEGDSIQKGSVIDLVLGKASATRGPLYPTLWD